MRAKPRNFTGKYVPKMNRFCDWLYGTKVVRVKNCESLDQSSLVQRISKGQLILTMSMPSWTIIAIGTSSFTGLFMLVTFIILGCAWNSNRKGSSSPFKLTYSSRKPSGILHNQLSLSKKACSMTSLQAYNSDLAVEAERDARRIIEKSSVFENWWDEEEGVQEPKGVTFENTTTKKVKGRFYTHPQYHSSTKKELNQSKYLDDENASLPGKVQNGCESFSCTDVINNNHKATSIKHVSSDDTKDFNL